MSLLTDKVFYEAIAANTGIYNAVEGRIYNTAIPLPDEDAENVPVPFVIITFESLENDGQNKDDYEGEYDNVTINVEVCAKNREELATLTEGIRAAVLSHFNTGSDTLQDLIPLDYAFSATAVNYDSTKPCFYQRLVYRCDTKK